MAATQELHMASMHGPHSILRDMLTAYARNSLSFLRASCLFSLLYISHKLLKRSVQSEIILACLNLSLYSETILARLNLSLSSTSSSTVLLNALLSTILIRCALCMCMQPLQSRSSSGPNRTYSMLEVLAIIDLKNYLYVVKELMS